MNKFLPIIFCISIAIVMLACRLMASVYTSGDDGYTYMAANSAQGWVASTWEMVVFQGRFYQLFIYPLAMLPFQFDQNWIVNIFRVVTFFWFLFGFITLVGQFLSRSHILGVLAVFLLTFETVGGSYNAFHGLPLWFGLICGMMMLSLALYLKALREEKNRLKNTILSSVCFFWALLGYEVSLLYTPLFLALSLYVRLESITLHSISNKMEAYKILSELWWVIGISVLYLITYFAFRYYYPGTYVGAQGFSLGTFKETLKPIWEFSINSVSLFKSVNADKTFSPTSFIFSFSLCLALVLSLKKDQYRNGEKDMNVRQATLIVMCLIAYVFLPNALFGFTHRYRVWAADGVQLYLGSIYSAICLSILLFSGLLLLLRRLDKIKILAIFCIFFAGLISGYANSKNSENFFKQSNMMSVRWDLANHLVMLLTSSPPIVSNDTIVLCSHGFIKNNELYVYFRNPDQIADAKIYWERFFAGHAGYSFILLDMQERKNRYKRDTCDIYLELSYYRNLGLVRVDSKDIELKFKLSELKSIPNMVDFPNRLFGF